MYNNLLDEFKTKHPDYEIIFLTKYGSQLYGFSTPESDTDIKGIFIPSKKDMLLGIAKHQWTKSTGNKESKNTKDDIDIELFSIHTFLDMLSSGKTNALDIMFATSNTECIIYTSKYWDCVQTKAINLINSNLSSFFGYCVGQANKYGIKGTRLDELTKLINYINKNKIDKNLKLRDIVSILDTFIMQNNPSYIKFNYLLDVEYLYVLGRNYVLTMTVKELIEHLIFTKSKYGKRAENAANGADLKALSHSFRILDESEELMTTGKITFPVKNANFIRELRKGNIDKDLAFYQLNEKLDYVRYVEKSANVLPACTSSTLRNEIISEIYWLSDWLNS
jgi:predicted nucleotidyltransferase